MVNLASEPCDLPPETAELVVFPSETGCRYVQPFIGVARSQPILGLLTFQLRFLPSQHLFGVVRLASDIEIDVELVVTIELREDEVVGSLFVMFLQPLLALLRV